jgi:1,4-alpha-glucan branching enzyme
MVSKPTYMGGLGFGMKWMMGWMHDTLDYFSKESVYRKYHQNQITFSIYYAFTENFMLPLSHDEVVYGKKPIIYKMPGDHWQQFANLRVLYAYMYAHPGTKLLYMGGEFGQTSEWNHERSLDWHLLDYKPHQGVVNLLRTLNTMYKEEAALYEYSFEESGFEWIDINDWENSVISWMRKGKSDKDTIIAIANFTPIPRENYRIGVPKKGTYTLLLNTDDEVYGGSGVVNPAIIESVAVPTHGKDNAIAVTLPPLGILYYKYTKTGSSKG